MTIIGVRGRNGSPVGESRLWGDDPSPVPEKFDVIGRTIASLGKRVSPVIPLEVVTPEIHPPHSREVLARITQIAHQDHVTQIPNQHGFESLCKRFANRMTLERHDLRTTVVVFDFVALSHFNNDYGSQVAGDIVLRAFGKALLDAGKRLGFESPEENVFVARTGGDEFTLVICKELLPIELEAFMDVVSHAYQQRLGKEIDACPLESDQLYDPEHKRYLAEDGAAARYGVALKTFHHAVPVEITLREMKRQIIHADACMYELKKHPKNRRANQAICGDDFVERRHSDISYQGEHILAGDEHTLVRVTKGEASSWRDFAPISRSSTEWTPPL